MTLWPNAPVYWPYTMTCSSTERTTETTMQTSSTCSMWPQKEGLIFNSKKCAIKQESVMFFGGVFSAEGYSPDPEKIKGISEMTPPQMKQELQSFLGAVNYLQTFVPHLSSNTAPPGPPQKGELLCLGRKHQHMLPENKVPTAESPPQTPEIL